MSAFIIAIIIGPGVGGINTCAEYNVAKHTDNKMIFFVILDKSLTIEDMSINAASQKTGIDIMSQLNLNLRILSIPKYDIKVLTIFLISLSHLKIFQEQFL